MARIPHRTVLLSRSRSSAAATSGKEHLVRAVSLAAAGVASSPAAVSIIRIVAASKQIDLTLSDGAMSPAQCRGGRAMLGWSQEELAEAAQVSRMTVVDFERAARLPHSNSVAAVRAALQAAGVEFI